ncbi:MAG TPA: 50S ribosomal protein L21 [Nitrospiria bacterium]|nr:50S ribosomal protein L21 [Nitrospiria bacterium]
MEIVNIGERFKPLDIFDHFMLQNTFILMMGETMYAVIESGGKQYKVVPGAIVAVERLPAEVGTTVKLDRVLLIQGDNNLTIGTPTIPGASVTGEVVAQGRAGKIVVFKKKRRKNYRRTRGHRQAYTSLKITEIKAAQ